MDDRRFDALIRSLAAGASRRAVLRGLLGLGGAVTGGVLLDDGVEAARRPKTTPKPVSCPGRQVPVDGQCACPSAAPHKCGPDCCTGTIGDPYPRPPGHTECCDNACCDGACYGEELCCPTNLRSGERPPTHQICQSTNRGTECCLFGEACCSTDGCCDTVCYGGIDNTSSCCSPGAFCPGNGSPDLCCADDFICCGAGTSGNACRDGSDENGCCTSADCSSNQVCENNQCVTPCSSATVHIFAQTHGPLESPYVCPAPFENVVTQIGLYPVVNGICADTPIATASTGADSPAVFDDIVAGVYCALPVDSALWGCLDCPDYGQGVGSNLTVSCGELFQWTIGMCQQGQHCSNGVCTDDDPCGGECTELEVCSNGGCACKPGTYDDIDNGCTLCDAGTYTSTAGNTTCLGCPFGSYAAAPGSTECTDCPPGTYNDFPSNDQCFQCWRGMYSGAGAAECTDCPAGTYNDIEGNDTCYQCAPGYYSFPGLIYCMPCTLGHYNDAPGSTSCTACPAGSYAIDLAATQCTPCAPGSYNPYSPNDSCEYCPAGAYAPNPGATICDPCPAGSYASQVGSTACTPCECGSTCSPTTGSC